MITALLISNVCLILISKGVPTWLDMVLSIAYGISTLTAFIIWHETKIKIKALLKEKGGADNG